MPIQTPYLKRFVKELKNLINPLIQDKGNFEPAELLHALRESLDYDKFICEDDIPSPDDSKIANIDQLQMVASKHRDIESLLNYTDSFKSEISNDKNGVRLMTIHKAKGLEYSVVFLIGLVNGILPNKQGDLEEERRIAFVAISRAMEKLYFSYSQEFMGKTVEKSQFLNEMFND